jgi:hypothetical protein
MRGFSMRRGIRFRHRRMYMPYMWGSFFWWPRMFMMGSFLYFLFGSTPYKVHMDNVTVIERETGKGARDLTEEELVEAMRRLGIRRLEVTDDELIAIERADR